MVDLRAVLHIVFHEVQVHLSAAVPRVAFQHVFPAFDRIFPSAGGIQRDAVVHAARKVVGVDLQDFVELGQRLGVIALVATPVLAVATKGRYYLRRTDDGIDLPMFDEYGNPSGATLTCHGCGNDFERPDMARCETHDAAVCSLCLSTDKVADHVLAAQP